MPVVIFMFNADLRQLTQICACTFCQTTYPLFNYIFSNLARMRQYVFHCISFKRDPHGRR